MINVNDLRLHVIRPTLQHLDKYKPGIWSQKAENILLGIAAVESDLGTKLVQYDGGPGAGIYQIEPSTNLDIWESVLSYHPELEQAVMALVPADFDIHNVESQSQLITNLAYQTAIARIQLWRWKPALPDSNDVAGQAKYWKTYFNSVDGKGTVEKFVAKYPL
ncbi:MAG: hypothetical protein V3T17_07085 [Pseudomonadales bacterium]